MTAGTASRGRVAWSGEDEKIPLLSMQKHNQENVPPREDVEDGEEGGEEDPRVC